METGISRHGGPRLAASRESTTTTDRQEDIGAAAPRWWQRAWHRVLPPPEAVPDQHHQLNRQLAVLEGARTELEAGWVQGSWWSATAGGHPDGVDGVCLVGALIRSGTSEDSATGRAVDAVYDALWASRGQPAPATQLVPSPQVRLARVRMLTQWNDRPERTKSEVMTVVDRAISATILALLTTPRAKAAPSANPASPPDPAQSHPPRRQAAHPPPPPPR